VGIGVQHGNNSAYANTKCNSVSLHQNLTFALMNDSAVLVRGCDTPCSQTQYEVKVNTIDNTNLFLDLNTMLSVYYNSVTVLERTEVLVYDLPQMLSAAGLGRLGMYLGISLLSIMSSARDRLGVGDLACRGRFFSQSSS
jgi:hypothetical protein